MAPFARRTATEPVRFPRTRNEHHPTEKPVELLVQLLQAAKEARTVYDPFAGSGSTLLACERHGATGYAMELDPTFVANAIARWEEETGKRAELAT